MNPVRESREAMRSGPGTSNPVVKVVHKGDTLTVIERRNGWVKGKTGQGNIGWVAEKNTSPLQ